MNVYFGFFIVSFKRIGILESRLAEDPINRGAIGQTTTFIELFVIIYLTITLNNGRVRQST